MSGSNNYLHYKDYVGSVEFSEGDAVFHGKVVGIKAALTASVRGVSLNTLVEEAIRQSVGQ